MRYLKFLLPFVVVGVIDLLFQLGAWEGIASPESHAGMSIAKKRALQDPAFQHIDFVALGSSRPVYGIDHALVARSAAANSFTYANLTVAGTHWMSLDVIADWLAVHHPEIRGGVIGLSVQDFLAPGNGTYELGIAYPFHTLAETSQMQRHVPFDWHDPATYGLYSGLFEYHEDVQDLLAHPQVRRKLLNYFHTRTPQEVLTGNADETSDMCAAPVATLGDCSALAARGDDHPKIRQQCKLIEAASSGRYDLRPFLSGAPLSERLQSARDLIRKQLRSLNWPHAPLVVLMPMPSVWTRDVMPTGAHDWALSVLEPLVEENKVRVLDYTDMFNTEAGTECSAFFDLYHNNVWGRQRLMERLMPELERDLFDSALPAASAVTAQ